MRWLGRDISVLIECIKYIHHQMCCLADKYSFSVKNWYNPAATSTTNSIMDITVMLELTPSIALKDLYSYELLDLC